MTDRQTDIFNPQKYSSQRCPVCNGFGTLKSGVLVCHGCKGKGFIVIDNKTGIPVERKTDENENNTH